MYINYGIIYNVVEAFEACCGPIKCDLVEQEVP